MCRVTGGGRKMSLKTRAAWALGSACLALLIAFMAISVKAQQAPSAAAPAAAAAQQAPGAPGTPGPGGRGAGRGQGGRPPAGFSGPQTQTPWSWDVIAMEDALPTKAYATPKQPRKVLVLAKAAGFVHSNIPLAAQTVKEMGEKTGAWSTTITYDPAEITADNLKQYDLIFLDNTTGQFLDDPNNEELTHERRQML